MQNITDGFAEGDDEKVIQILEKWKGGKLSTRLFTTLSGMVPTPCLEVVVLRESGDKIQALLVPRPENDIVWRGMMHSPGGALRKMDYTREDGNPFNGVFERLENDEIKNKFQDAPKFITSYPIMTPRGPELVVLFLAKLDENATIPEGAGWYDVEKLSSMPNVIKHQLKAVEEAARNF